MARETIAITQDFINQCTEVLQEFGGARYASFISFIEEMLEVSSTCAETIADRMMDRKDIRCSPYADTMIVKPGSARNVNYKNLDAFDAYMRVLLKEKAEKETRMAYANKGKFPIDFSIYVSSGRIYYMLVYDNTFIQKYSIYERKQMDAAFDPVTLVVFPVGTNLKAVKMPKIQGQYMLAVVRKSKNGLTECQISEIQGGENK